MKEEELIPKCPHCGKRGRLLRTYRSMYACSNPGCRLTSRKERPELTGEQAQEVWEVINTMLEFTGGQKYYVISWLNLFKK